MQDKQTIIKKLEEENMQKAETILFNQTIINILKEELNKEVMIK